MKKKEIKTIIGGSKLNHAKRITSLKYTPDGKYLVSCSWDNTICIWDVMNGDLVKQIKSSATYLNSVAVSPDSSKFACGGKTIVVYNLLSFKKLFSLKKHKHDIGAIEFSPNGKIIASGCGEFATPNIHALKISNATDGSEIIKTKHNAINALAFSSDSSKLATCCKLGFVKVWDVKTLKCLVSKNISENFDELNGIQFGDKDEHIILSAKNVVILNPKTLDEIKQIVPSNFSNNFLVKGGTTKQLIAYTDSYSNVAFDKSDIILLDAKSFKTIQQIPDQQGGPLAISPCGSMIAIGANNKISSWKISNNKPVLIPDTNHSEIIADADFNEDGSVLYTISSEDAISWNTKTGKAIQSWKLGSSSICHIEDDIVGITYREEIIAIFEFENNRDITELQMDSAEWGDNNLLKCVNGIIGYTSKNHFYLWNKKNYKLIQKFDKPCTVFDIESNGNLVAFGNMNDDTVWLSDINNSFLDKVKIESDEMGICALQFCSGKNSLIVLYNSGTRIVWDILKKENVYEKKIKRPDGHSFQNGQHGFLSVSNCSKHYAIIINNTIEIYSLIDYTMIHSMDFSNRESPWFIKFSPNGKKLLSSHKDLTTCIWDLETIGLKTLLN